MPMSRRRHKDRKEEHDNHDRWMVSYADFITLLFAFFVVMYAVSSVNEGKYRVLSDSIVSAFRDVPGSSTGAQVSLTTPGQVLVLPMILPNKQTNATNAKSEEARRQTKAKMRNLAQEISNALAPLVQSGQVRVTEGALGITIEINASILFLPGDALLGGEAIRTLTAVSKILAPTDFPIIVEGHTDNMPIASSQFPSNWELSGVRASSVVRLFIDNGVSAGRLSARGYADQRPLADNTQVEGRARNRRVAITIESTTPDGPAS